MAATLALTSSGNISPVSDLGVVPSDGSPGSPLMAATLALAPGLERLLTLSQGRISVRLSVDHAIYTQSHRGFGGVCVWLAVSGRVGVPALAFIRGIGLPGCSCPQGRQGREKPTHVKEVLAKSRAAQAPTALEGAS